MCILPQLVWTVVGYAHASPSRMWTKACAPVSKSQHLCDPTQGDVGSGKTAVAFLALAAAAGSGMQAALMAPTEVLASQHFTRLQARSLGTFRSIIRAVKFQGAFGPCGLYRRQQCLAAHQSCRDCRVSHRLAPLQESSSPSPKHTVPHPVRPSVCVPLQTTWSAQPTLPVLQEYLAGVPRAAMPDGRRITVGLLTGSTKVRERRGIYEELAQGELALVRCQEQFKNQ